MKYNIVLEKQFKKELRRIKKRGYNLSLLSKVVNILADGKPLDPKYKDHPLVGNYK